MKNKDDAIPTKYKNDAPDGCDVFKRQPHIMRIAKKSLLGFSSVCLEGC
jgi:hypothetical protein